MSTPEYTLDELKAARQLKLQGVGGTKSNPFTLDELKAARNMRAKNQPLSDDNLNQIASQSLLQNAAAGASDFAGNLMPDIFKSALEKLGVLSRPEQEEFGNRAVQGLGKSLMSGARGISQLVGGPEIPKTQVPASQTLAGDVGSGLGQLAGYGAMLAPFAVAGESAIPGVIGELLGGAAGGSALEERGQRLAGGLEGAGAVIGGRAIAKYLPEALSKASSLFKDVSHETPYYRIQEGFNNRLASARENYKDIYEDVGRARESGKLPATKISDPTWNLILAYGPKTDAFKLTVKKARGGDFDSLRRVQSVLGKRATAYKGKVEKQDAAEVLAEARDKINNAIERNLLGSDMGETASRLRQTGRDYADIMNTYTELNPIAKLVGPEQKVPTTHTPLLQKSTGQERLLEAHPEILQDLLTLKNKKEAARLLGKLGTGIAAMIGMREGAQMIKGGEE